ncbi:hypothetical protein [Haloarcula marina]|uniref:hypothetical protein n=1 Tax=Haloarcula marina TaxID=2961574 RepID=UPI0020B901E7|nr:hypothetical protein [Halomicroarcula marina]
MTDSTAGDERELTRRDVLARGVGIGGALAVAGPILSERAAAQTDRPPAQNEQAAVGYYNTNRYPGGPKSQPWQFGYSTGLTPRFTCDDPNQAIDVVCFSIRYCDGTRATCCVPESYVTSIDREAWYAFESTTEACGTNRNRLRVRFAPTTDCRETETPTDDWTPTDDGTPDDNGTPDDAPDRTGTPNGTNTPSDTRTPNGTVTPDTDRTPDN